MRCLIMLSTLWFGTMAQAGEHPRWPDLAELLKEAKDSKKVTRFVRAHSLTEAARGPSGSFTAPDRAYSLMYRESQVSAIVLRVSDWPAGLGEKHWKPYSKKLPARLSATDGRAAVIKKLGNPVNNRKNTWLHNGLYLWVHFNETKSRVNEMYVSPRVIEASTK